MTDLSSLKGLRREQGSVILFVLSIRRLHPWVTHLYSFHKWYVEPFPAISVGMSNTLSFPYSGHECIQPGTDSIRLSSSAGASGFGTFAASIVSQPEYSRRMSVRQHDCNTKSSCNPAERAMDSAAANSSTLTQLGRHTPHVTKMPWHGKPKEQEYLF